MVSVGYLDRTGLTWGALIGALFYLQCVIKNDR